MVLRRDEGGGDDRPVVAGVALLAEAVGSARRRRRGDLPGLDRRRNDAGGKVLGDVVQDPGRDVDRRRREIGLSDGERLAGACAGAAAHELQDACRRDAKGPALRCGGCRGAERVLQDGAIWGENTSKRDAAVIGRRPASECEIIAGPGAGDRIAEIILAGHGDRASDLRAGLPVHEIDDIEAADTKGRHAQVLCAGMSPIDASYLARSAPAITPENGPRALSAPRNWRRRHRQLFRFWLYVRYLTTLFPPVALSVMPELL